MALFSRALVCSYRLSVYTNHLASGIVWPEFVMQVLTRGCQSQFGGRGGRRGLTIKFVLIAVEGHPGHRYLVPSARETSY